MLKCTCQGRAKFGMNLAQVFSDSDDEDLCPVVLVGDLS